MMEPKINPDIIAFAKIIDDMYNLYVQKNSNYGNSFSDSYKDYGAIAGLVPLRYKFDRIDNLMRGGENNFESLRDNLIDLANYAIMNVIELDKALETADRAEDTSDDQITKTNTHSGKEVSNKVVKKKKILNEGNAINLTNTDLISEDINLEAKYDEYKGGEIDQSLTVDDNDTLFSSSFTKRENYN